MLEPFRGKQLRGILVGDSLTADDVDRQMLLRHAEADGFTIYLPSASGYAPAGQCDSLGA